jgi:hypothetical protein
MTVPGFDFSEWQGPIIDFNKAKSVGAQFCVARAAYGLIADKIFPAAFDAAKAVGLITGCYQFADYRTYAKYNVAKLMDHLGGRQPDFVALDLENNDTYWPGMWPSDSGRLTYWVNDWATELRLTKLTCPVLLYTNPGIIKLMRAAPVLLSKLTASMDLWTTWWDPGEPTAAAIAPWLTYKFVQPKPSAVGKVYGMESGNLDMDYYPGTLDELKAFVARTPPPLTIDQRLNVVEAILRTHGWMQ